MEFFKYRILAILMLSIFYGNCSASIDGIRIQIDEAKLYGTVHIPLVDKRIKSVHSIFSLGQTVASRATKKLYQNNEFYILMIEDSHSKGKLHAIVKGDYLKKYPHYISTLTEVAFLLSQDFIGKKYDKVLLEKHLNEIAKKVIKRKGFVLENNYEIDYSDVLLYEDRANVLNKSYDEYLKPLKEKINKNTLSYKDAYSFVYNKVLVKNTIKPKTTKTKKVKPLYRLVVFLHVPQNAKIGTTLTQLKQLRKGSASVDAFEILGGSVPFRIDKNGVCKVAARMSKKSYSFDAIAHTKDGNSNKIGFVVVIDKIKNDSYYKIKE